MCKGEFVEENAAEQPQWHLEKCGEVWRFSLPALEMPDVDLNDRAVKLQMKAEGRPCGSPMLIEVPAHAAPVVVDSAKCKYSTRRKELVIEWVRQVTGLKCSKEPQISEPTSVPLSDEAHAQPGIVHIECPHASLMVVPPSAEASMDSPDLAGCSVAAVVVDDPVIQELPMPEPELSAQDWKLQGNAAIKEGDLEGAVSHYTAGLGVSHSDIEVEAVLCSNRALCLQKLGRHEEALADAERCMHLRPHFVKGFLRAAISLRALGRPCEALAALRRAPNDDEACSMAAELRPEAEAAEKVRLQTLPPAERMQAEADLSFAKGLFEVASARYSEVLRDAPEGSLAVAARMGRAACSHQLSDFKAVVDDTSFVLEREPANLVALSRRMLAFEPLEKYQAALADARAVLLQEPTNVTANKLQHRLGKLVRDIEREQSSTA